MVDIFSNIGHLLVSLKDISEWNFDKFLAWVLWWESFISREIPRRRDGRSPILPGGNTLSIAREKC